MASGRRRRIAVVLSFLTLMTAPLPQRAAAAVEADLLPDLAMARPVDLRLVKSADGQRRLRFTANIVNIGEGPFETRASRASSSQATMPVKQRIYDAAGGHRVVSTSAIASYSGDGHDHWHVQRVAAYGLYDVVNGRAIARSSKVGFCLFDTRPYRLTLPHAPVSRGYGPSGCGTRTALSLRHGTSVGWADRYGWELRYQSINVSHLPPGEYLLKVTADPNGFFVERSDTNNCNWTRLRLPSSGDRVTILGVGSGMRAPRRCADPDAYAHALTERHANANANANAIANTGHPTDRDRAIHPQPASGRRSAMTQLIVVAFDHFDDARNAMAGLRSLEREGQIRFEDTAIVERDPDGTAHVKNEVSGTTETAAAIGAMIGGLVTFVFPLAGIALGAALGALVGRSLDRGVSDAFVDEVKLTLRPGRSALFLVVKESNADATLAALRAYKGDVVQTTLDSETEEALRQALE